MAEKIVLLDTSILIDFYRKTNKNNTVWVDLLNQNYGFVISAITKYEIYNGISQDQKDYWDKILNSIQVLVFDEAVVDTAIQINDGLKKKRKQIEIADLFIGATAFYNNLPIATLNKKHFERIENLVVL